MARIESIGGGPLKKRLSESIVPCGGESGLLVTERWTTDDERWCRRSLGVVVLVANEVSLGEEQRSTLAVHLHHTVAVKGSNELFQTSNRQEPSGLSIRLLLRGRHELSFI